MATVGSQALGKHIESEPHADGVWEMTDMGKVSEPLFTCRNERGARAAIRLQSQNGDVGQAGKY